MSYDLMVFDPEKVPKTRNEFMAWYDRSTQWSELDYNDITNATPALVCWYHEMRVAFPPMNGPYADPDEVRAADNSYTTDYSIGPDFIYIAFAWSLADAAYKQTRAMAEKHKVGFFDVSSDNGDVVLPGGNFLASDTQEKGEPAVGTGFIAWLRRLFGGASKPVPATADEAELTPFRLCDTGKGKDVSTSLLLDLDGADFKTHLFKAADAEDNGYNWEVLAKAFLKESRPDLAEKIDFDSEAGMFCAYSKDKAAIMQFAIAFRRLCDDEKKIAELLACSELE